MAFEMSINILNMVDEFKFSFFCYFEHIKWHLTCLLDIPNIRDCIQVVFLIFLIQFMTFEFLLDILIMVEGIWVVFLIFWIQQITSEFFLIFEYIRPHINFILVILKMSFELVFDILSRKIVKELSFVWNSRWYLSCLFLIFCSQ